MGCGEAGWGGGIPSDDGLGRLFFAEPRTARRHLWRFLGLCPGLAATPGTRDWDRERFLGVVVRRAWPYVSRAKCQATFYRISQGSVTRDAKSSERRSLKFRINCKQNVRQDVWHVPYWRKRHVVCNENDTDISTPRAYGNRQLCRSGRRWILRGPLWLGRQSLGTSCTCAAHRSSNFMCKRSG